MKDLMISGGILQRKQKTSVGWINQTRKGLVRLHY
jgi:hypothetical protein